MEDRKHKEKDNVSPQINSNNNIIYNHDNDNYIQRHYLCI